MVTQGTMQKPGQENAAYVKALLRGDDLTSWHEQVEWRAALTVGEERQGALQPSEKMKLRRWRVRRWLQRKIQTASRHFEQSGTRTLCSIPHLNSRVCLGNFTKAK